MNQDRSLVSIVTPSYNQGRFIEETILSVMGQDYPYIQHIIIDGGSTDSTLSILREYEKKYNLAWISEPDRGQSDAINKGLLRASGSIIGWLNSDDTYLPGAVSSAVKILNRRPEIDWVHGNCYWIDEIGDVLSVFPVKAFNLPDLLIFGMHIAQPTIFFRHRLIEDIGGLDINIDSAMDYDFMLRMSRHYEGSFIPDYLATRRLHKDAKSISSAHTFYHDTITSLDKLYSDSSLPPEIIRLKRLAYHHAYLVGGYQAFIDKDYVSARQLLTKSIKLDPRPWKKDTIASIVLLIESVLGIHLIVPGISRRWDRANFRSGQASINLNWKKSR